MTTNDIKRVAYAEKLLNENKIEKVKKICKKNMDNNRFISIYIKILLIEGKKEEAKKFCVNNLNHIPIVSQYLVILLSDENYEEAMNICKKHENNEEIIPQYITVLEHFNDFEEIEKLSKMYPYNKYVAKSCAFTYMRKQEFEKAIKVCEKHLYDKDILQLYNDLKEMYKNQLNKNNDTLFDSNIYLNATEYMKCGELKKAKEECKKNLDDKKIYELYIYILEKEKINNSKNKKLEMINF